ncbi:molybdenum cofactor guanylyltransferase [Neobacillus sp. D3-1R]|uniref:molybdenum cofactor guanylyltransferase n=1 Tax=Neobacillus sp. D3-1R TaxID=3445778 RepID=UPI003F9F02FE
MKTVIATGIILAGGNSSRMGTNKALLKIGQKTVIEKVIEEIRPITSELIVVTNHFDEYEFLGLPLVADKRKGMGPLAGLEAGLLASSTEKNLLVACDMPFISQTLAQLLLEQLSQNDAAVPYVEGRMHPLFAAYRKSCLPEIQKSLDENQLRMRSFFERIRLKVMDELKIDTMTLFNMNEPSEYEKAVQYKPFK